MREISQSTIYRYISMFLDMCKKNISDLYDEVKIQWNSEYQRQKERNYRMLKTIIQGEIYAYPYIDRIHKDVF